MLEVIVTAVWLMMPAYISNPTAVVFGGGTPIDLGKNWKDGRRILGDGKTFRGLIGGTACGIAVGLIQMQLFPVFSLLLSSPSVYLTNFTLTAVVALSFGALLGDIVKSFFKRRLGYGRGARLPLIDQLDFVAGAWVLTYVLDPRWFSANFLSSPWVMVTVLVLTPVFHRLTNIFGYRIKLKKEPW